MNPPKEQEYFNQLFCFLRLLDPKAGMVYTDFTGKFPLCSIHGNTILVVLYDWTTSSILTTPVVDIKESTVVETFKHNIEYLTTRGFKPSFNIMDNVASKTVQTYLTKEKMKLQLVEPHKHRVNATKCSIQTFKNHLIAGLSTVDDKCPATLWDQFILQTQDSLNMLWTSRVHPQLSAYHVVERLHDFNRVPWCPIGTRATIFNPPETQTSFGPHTINAFYVAPAPKHYRCWKFYVPSTGGNRISNQATFSPTLPDTT